MTVLKANPSERLAETPVRAGGQILSLFATPLNGLVLRALADGPMRLSKLQTAVGSPSQTTLRANLANLVEIGVVTKRKLIGSPRAVMLELAPFGDEVLWIADALEAWLAEAPHGPIALDSGHGKGVIKALSGGWDSAILHALANRPFSLTELDKLISDHSYPALERRLSMMDSTCLIEALPTAGPRTLYTVTDWVRYAIGPLAAAIRCERRNMAAQAAPITNVEVEAAFLLALPLISLPRRLSGTCALVVDIGASEDRDSRVAGVWVQVERGRLLNVSEDLGRDPPCWALGSIDSWLTAVSRGSAGTLRLGGISTVAQTDLVRGIYRALYGEEAEERRRAATGRLS